MIPIKELKASYIKVLREAVPGMRIYSNEVEEGYETPSLFVQMIPLIFKQREQQVSHDQVICLKRRFYSIRKMMPNSLKS